MIRAVYMLAILAAALSAPTAATCAQGDKPVEIEVLLFAGGEGMEFFLQCARDYEKIHPEVRVNLSGDPRMEDKVKVRILEGTFPEVTNIPVGSASWSLIREGFIQPMDEFLDRPAWDGHRTWRDSFLPGTLDKFSYQGKVYGVPLPYWVFAMWYNKAMFEEHRWKPARTWDELFALCEQVKAAGIAPIAFQGRYPDYANSLVQAGYYHLVGPERFAAMLNLEKGSFDNPQFRQAAGLAQKLAVNYFQPGSMGMSHTEAQMQFFLGKTAMIDCGSWLKSEMLGKIPDGFRLGTFNLPIVEGGKRQGRSDRDPGHQRALLGDEAQPASAGRGRLPPVHDVATDGVAVLSAARPARGRPRGIRRAPVERPAGTRDDHQPGQVRLR
ncbi:MAG: extracellular solute-binding protein [Planctomycetota bacterium]|nr:extracellular solute-binding protein [Planctomycetota bacterium]